MTSIVIAEDEAIIRLDLRELLEEEGYTVVGEAGRGDQAVELVRSLRPDLVILDVKMPGMDGIEAARRITAEQICAVLMLTAFSQREVIEQARDAGALAYLVKPFQKTDLVPAIELAIARYGETKALAAEVSELAERLEVRKIVDRAKGRLIDVHGMKEADAFAFIQKSAMAGQRARTRGRDRRLRPQGEDLPSRTRAGVQGPAREATRHVVRTARRHQGGARRCRRASRRLRGIRGRRHHRHDRRAAD
ncbi:MAG: response regulator [Actinobacteria bacterium]|nr:response regulator [Actinomycetota bacterium]